MPEYMKDRLDRSDPAIVGGPKNHGLLHVIEPETVVDKAAAEKLAEAMAELISSGALDDLAGQETAFAELSMSRLGFRGAAELAGMVVEELGARGLARKAEDGVSIPLHPAVRAGARCQAGRERPKAFKGRQEELDDLARDLKVSSRRAWRRPAASALTLAGASWTAASGNPIGAASGGGADAYSYLFRAVKGYGWPRSRPGLRLVTASVTPPPVPMRSARQPGTASAMPKIPDNPAELTCVPSLSTASPKEMRLTPILTQESRVRSLARCSRTRACVSESCSRPSPGLIGPPPGRRARSCWRSP